MSLYERANNALNDALVLSTERCARSELMERLRMQLAMRVYCLKVRARYQHQERMIRLNNWANGLHFLRIPATRYTSKLTFCLSPRIGVGMNTNTAFVGVRWARTLTITSKPGTNLKVRKWESAGFFMDVIPFKAQVW